MSARIGPFESLEVRRLLASAVAPLTWGFSGTDNVDNISVTYRARDARLIASVNGIVTETRLAKNVDVLMISGLAGNDVVTGSAGSDLFSIGYDAIRVRVLGDLEEVVADLDLP